MTRPTTAALVGLALLLAPSRSHAWKCNRVVDDPNGECVRWCATPSYRIGTLTADVPDARAFPVVQRAMQDWTTFACTGLGSEHLGRTGAQPVRNDGQEVVGWVESGWPYDENTLGMTLWNYYSWGTEYDYIPPQTAQACIREADIILNGQHWVWSVDGVPDRHDVYSIIAHEAGHFYGFDHSDDPGSAMFVGLSTGEITPLNGDDQVAACTTYPAASPTAPNCEVTGCPAGQTCLQRVCVSGRADGTVCARCLYSDDCGGAADICLFYASGSFCGKQCASNADCPEGARCSAVGDTMQCIGNHVGGPTPCDPECRVDADCGGDRVCDFERCQAPPERKGFGEACTSGAECDSELCAASPTGGGVCSRACDGLDPASCPPDYYCAKDLFATCNEGQCLPGQPGDGAPGDACDADTDCASLSCESGKCTLPCRPGGIPGCPGGMVCTSGSNDCGRCVAASPPGAACEVNEDCTSLICAEGDSGPPFCTVRCAEDTDCPDDMVCTAFGGDALCTMAAPNVGPDPVPTPDAGAGAPAPDASVASPDAGIRVPDTGAAVRRLNGGCAVSFATATRPGIPARDPGTVALLVLAGILARRRR